MARLRAAEVRDFESRTFFLQKNFDKQLVSQKAKRLTDSIEQSLVAVKFATAIYDIEKLEKLDKALAKVLEDIES